MHSFQEIIFKSSRSNMLVVQFVSGILKRDGNKKVNAINAKCKNSSVISITSFLRLKIRKSKPLIPEYWRSLRESLKFAIFENSRKIQSVVLNLHSFFFHAKHPGS